jgi:hypothetical protein
MQIRATAISSFILCGACALATAQVPVAADGDDKVAEVEVSAIRNPELKPYRVMSAGLDAFDEYHALAPTAALKFRLSKRSDRPGHYSHWDGLSLRLAGDETSVPISIDTDGRFVLPRSKEAYDDNAELMLNQKKTTALFWVETRTPGVAANARRLGDLRLECKVLVAMGKKEINFALRAAFTTALGTGDWCAASKARIATPLPDWAMNATVVHGGTRKALGPSSAGFNAPIQDKALPDDAVIEFDYWGEASAERRQQFMAQYPLQLKTSMNKWAAGAPFASSDKVNYTAVMVLKPGTWKFNLESPDRKVNLGVNRKDALSATGVVQPLVWYGSQLNVSVAQAGMYSFALNMADPVHPAVTITRVDAASGSGND